MGIHNVSAVAQEKWRGKLKIKTGSNQRTTCKQIIYENWKLNLPVVLTTKQWPTCNQEPSEALSKHSVRTYKQACDSWTKLVNQFYHLNCKPKVSVGYAHIHILTEDSGKPIGGLLVVNNRRRGQRHRL